MYTYRKLRGRIIEKYGTLSNFAEISGMSLTWLSAKLNNRSGLSQQNMDLWAKLLDIELVEYGEYFFK